jgi:hypothetical protein
VGIVGDVGVEDVGQHEPTSVRKGGCGVLDVSEATSGAAFELVERR